jgi:hypothetical protein
MASGGPPRVAGKGPSLGQEDPGAARRGRVDWGIWSDPDRGSRVRYGPTGHERPEDLEAPRQRPSLSEIRWDLLAFRDVEGNGALLMEFGAEILDWGDGEDAWGLAAVPMAGGAGRALPTSMLTLMAMLQSMGLEVAVVVDRGEQGLAAVSRRLDAEAREAFGPAWIGLILSTELSDFAIESVEETEGGRFIVTAEDPTGLATLRMMQRLFQRREFLRLEPQWIELRTDSASREADADDVDHEEVSP